MLGAKSPFLMKWNKNSSQKAKQAFFIYYGRAIHFPYKLHPIIMFSISLLNL
jgi:hypothetical protein